MNSNTIVRPALGAFVLPLALIGMNAAGKTGASKRMEHATGTFEVAITPEANGEAPEGGVATARMGMRKALTGDLMGTAIGTMISGGTPSPGNAAAYVAIDQFNGSLKGKRGGFMLVHRGTMTKAGGQDLVVIVAPDSGTGELAGISGTFAIKVEGGVHKYDLSYSLPKP